MRWRILTVLWMKLVFKIEVQVAARHSALTIDHDTLRYNTMFTEEGDARACLSSMNHGFIILCCGACVWTCISQIHLNLAHSHFLNNLNEANANFDRPNMCLQYDPKHSLITTKVVKLKSSKPECNLKFFTLFTFSKVILKI